MFAGGLVEEVRSILARGFSPDCKPLQSLGYLQVVQFLQGEIPLQAAADATKQATRNYAKRQLTWFRKEEDVTWFPGFGDEDSLGSDVEAYAAEFIRTGKGQPSGTSIHPVLLSAP